jgi:hypothetical protein
VGPVVFFYAVDCKPTDKKVKAVEIQPKPRAIYAKNTVADKVRNNTSEIVEIPDQKTWTGEPIRGNTYIFFTKPNYFKKQCFSSSFLIYRSKMAMQYSAG